MDNALRRPGQTTGRQLAPILLLFGALYFVQGIIEPTACLPAQPIQAHLRSSGFSADQIGRFFGVIAIAWSLKPLFGLVSDFLPIGGRRRRPYLILATAATALAFFLLAASWQSGGATAQTTFGRLITATTQEPDVARFGWTLMWAGFGIAMTDVVIDALAVETGQPLGITGQIQSVQWLALSVAGLLAGAGGGFIAQHGLQRAMSVGCGLLALMSLLVVLFAAREPRHAVLPRQGLRRALAELWAGRRLQNLLATAVFLFLWNFNPFSSNVLQSHMTQELHLSEQFYGYTLSVQAVGMIIACIGYGWYCRRVPFFWLIHLSIAAGIASSLGYLLLRDQVTALLASFIWGFAWQTGVLVQLDLAARTCPLQSAGTMFALLMAITNTGQSAGIYLGGGWYERLADYFAGNRQAAFFVLVIISSGFTATCWLVTPWLKHAARMAPDERDKTESPRPN